MGSGVGLQTVFGTAVEGTYGTPVAPNRFHEILSESLGRNNKILQSNGLRGGGRNLRRGSRRVLSGRSASGSVRMEVSTTGMGRWFQHLLGGNSTIAGGLQTHTMGDLSGKSLTVQKQIRDASQTVISPFTLHGVKVLSGEFSIDVDQILQLALDLDAEDIDTSTAAAAASYTNTELFHFGQGTLTVGGAVVANVLKASTKITNALNVERYYIGSGGLKKEPVDNDFPTVTGSLTAEFDSAATFYNRFAADSAAALKLEFVNSGATARLTIDVPEVRFTGETPKVGGPAVIAMDVPYEGAYDGTNTGCKIEYLSADLAI